MQYFNVNMLIWYAVFGMLTLAIGSLLPLKANHVLCSVMGSNSPCYLFNMYFLKKFLLLFYQAEMVFVIIWFLNHFTLE